MGALVNVGDEVGYGSGGNADTVAPTTGVMTKSMVVASTSSTNIVIGTDRTIALASTSSNAPVQIINRLNDRDKRAALQVTLKAGTNDAGKLVASTKKFTCDTGATLCSDFKINDLIRLHSVMTNGQNQPAMDGILSSKREQIVLTRLNTFPCSVEETRKGTSESLECSGRGLCDGSSGECACFEGYTSDDCS